TIQIKVGYLIIEPLAYGCSSSVVGVPEREIVRQKTLIKEFLNRTRCYGIIDVGSPVNPYQRFLDRVRSHLLYLVFLADLLHTLLRHAVESFDKHQLGFVFVSLNQLIIYRVVHDRINPTAYFRIIQWRATVFLVPHIGEG